MTASRVPAEAGYQVLNLLATPLWIVASHRNELLFANGAAAEISASSGLHELRQGSHSAHAEEQLAAYLPALRAREPVIEIWTLLRHGEAVPLSCRLSLLDGGPHNEQILVEGILSSLPPLQPSLPCDLAGSSLYSQLFHSNGAPMLLIDPAADGRVVDANLAACRFYGYTREAFCRKHTWEINALGRQVLPIMSEVAKLPGGHRPLNFMHRLADGGMRDVQTYASPLDLNGRRLMLCVIHDVTQQNRLRNELENAASRDPLTGLWNRRHFLILLANARDRKLHHDTECSLLILDVDHFKRINDRFGHDKGDEVLVMLAKTLEKRVRETDAVCRWGGEEFAILLPKTDIDNAAHLAERLRVSVAEIQVPDLPRFSVSIGVARHARDETIESLFRRADAALYQAKAAGRNQVIVG